MFARCLSALKDERVEASKQLKGPAVTKYSGDKKEFIEHVRKVSKYLSIKSTHFNWWRRYPLTCYKLCTMCSLNVAIRCPHPSSDVSTVRYSCMPCDAVPYITQYRTINSTYDHHIYHTIPYHSTFSVLA